MARRRGGAPPPGASRPAPEEEEDRRDDDGPRTGGGEPSFPGVGGSQPSGGSSTPDRGSDSDDDDDDFTDRREDNGSVGTDTPTPPADARDDPRPGRSSSSGGSGGRTASNTDSISAAEPDIFDPTAPDSPGGSSVGSQEAERYLREAEAAGVSIENLEDQPALAEQIGRQIGFDAVEEAAQRGGVDDVSVTLDLDDRVARFASDSVSPIEQTTRSSVGSRGELRAAVNRFGQQQLLNQQSRGDRRAAVNRFGQAQLSQFNFSDRRQEQRALIDEFFQRPRNIQEANFEGGDARLFNEQESTNEQFGDIRVTNPLTGNRVEKDLDRAAGRVDAAIREEIEESIDSPSFLQNPALNFGARLVGAERATLAAAGLFGQDVEDVPFTEVENGQLEGPVERSTEAAFRGAGGVINLPELAAEGKEIAEFGLTQGPRISDSLGAVGATLDGPVSGRDELAGENGLEGGDARLLTEAQDQRNTISEDPFARDVATRTAGIAATAAESFREDPLESTAAFGGGLAGSLVGGATAGKAVRRASGGRVSGSDISGRVLLGTERRIDNFLSDDRGQLDFGDSRGDSGGGGASDFDMDAIDDALERFERGTRTREAKRRARERVREEQERLDPPDATTVSRREGRSVTARESRTVSGGVDTARSGPTAAEASAGFGRRFDVDESLSPRESQLAANLNTPDADLRTVAEDIFTPEGVRVNQVRAADSSAGQVFDAAAGASAAVSGALGRAETAQEPTITGAALDDSVADGVLDGVLSGSESGVGSLSDTGAGTDVFSDVGSDVFTDTGVDIFSRAGAGSRTRIGGRTELDFRFDTRSDTRSDTRNDLLQDTRFDTRNDTRQDSRQDVRNDSRQDTRLDLPGLDGDEGETDLFGSLGFGLSDEVFDTGVVQSLDELEARRGTSDPFTSGQQAADDVFSGSGF